MLFGITGTESTPEVYHRAIQAAVDDASARGWEAIILVLVMLGLISLTGFIVRWLIHSMDKRLEEATIRENRMADRLNELETFTRTTLLKVIDDTSVLITKVFEGMNHLGSLLAERPCLMDLEQIETAKKTAKKD